MFVKSDIYIFYRSIIYKYIVFSVWVKNLYCRTFSFNGNWLGNMINQAIIVSHYENTPMQLTAIFTAVKMTNLS